LNEEAAKSREMVAKVLGANPAAASSVKPSTIATDIDCDECGKPMIIRNSRRGYFLGCSGYPKCKNTGDVPANLADQLGLNNNGKGETPSPTPEKLDESYGEIETDLSVE
jgi:ssDNA-binding Zn-finger/Zn-ribbon topoisomerase 1